MTPELITALLAQMSGEDVLAVSEQHLARASAPRETPPAGSVRIIPVIGALSARGMQGWFGRIAGMDDLRREISAAAGNDEVSAIVLDIDSPGGSVAGTQETGEAVAAAAARKPVVAVANSLAASAAYWIGAQASEFVVTPGSISGSIGVIAMHQNAARMLERIGLEVTLIRSGERKAEGHPFGPLNEVARESLQARVDAAAGEFYAAVAQGRKLGVKTVKDRFGSGATFTASEAVANGLADRQASLAQVVAELSAGKSRVMRRRYSALAFA